jgi:uncharacterized protein with PQ loop repeat
MPYHVLGDSIMEESVPSSTISSHFQRSLTTAAGPTTAAAALHASSSSSSSASVSNVAGAGVNVATASGWSLFASKAVGYLIIFGSGLVKIPQVLSIVRSRSVDGISPSLFALELYTATVNTLFHIAHGFPFSTYGENIFLGAPNFVILYLYMLYAKRVAKKSQSTNTDSELDGESASESDIDDAAAAAGSDAASLLHRSHTASARVMAAQPQFHTDTSTHGASTGALLKFGAGIAVYASVIGMLVRQGIRSPASRRVLELLQSTTIPIYVISRIPQIWSNYKNGSTGQLSSVGR